MPCEFIGPVSEKFLREKYRRQGIADEKADELVSNIPDWYWDTLVLRTLVKVEAESGEISSGTAVPENLRFPIQGTGSVNAATTQPWGG